MLSFCFDSQNVTVCLCYSLYIHLFVIMSPSFSLLPSSRSNETSGGAEETGGAPQPGAAETKADRDEVCFLYRANY